MVVGSEGGARKESWPSFIPARYESKLLHPDLEMRLHDTGSKMQRASAGGPALTTVELYFVEEIMRLKGKQVALDWIRREKESESLNSDACSTRSSESFASSCGGVSLATEASGLSTTSTHSMESTRSSASTVAGTHRARAGGAAGERKEPATTGRLHQLLLHVVEDIPPESGPGRSCQLHKSNSAPIEGVAHSPKAYDPALLSRFSVDGGISRLLSAELELARQSDSQLAALSEVNAEIERKADEVAKAKALTESVDRSGLLYTDAAHLVCEDEAA